jgi:hypothetical protein
VFEDDDNVRDLWDNSHQEGDIRVSKDALHNDLVLNFGEKFVGQSWVKDLLYSNRRSVEVASVDNRETTLSDLFCNF